MTEEIALDFDKLRQHAALVSSVADDVNKAIASVKGGNLAENAFGIMCAFLVPQTLAMTVAGSGMLNGKMALLLRTAGELKQTASQWEQIEADVKGTWDTIQKAMD
ncbi:type VII secretion target [Schumannella sp. 10F1B-5-1]|uniref:type VII secretion target n=1 Tax=Schumannella sp. 10F1B-5-1 TaxID=2590780 RepID=UPI00113296EC|nr:type VII secretion target [Schumannella sp. 10F1B-5-1]TPW76740.1 hypothetical protein FJ658_02010 [Schumannella sp. 10F1B-5-1]